MLVTVAQCSDDRVGGCRGLELLCLNAYFLLLQD